MKIFVVDTKSRRKVFEVENNQKIKELKDKIREKNGVNTNVSIELLSGGQILEDEETIEYYDIEEYNVLTYIGEFRGGIFL